MDLDGTTFLITGANRGIGRALTTAALARGAARVYATARRPETLADLTDPRVVALRLDVRDPASVAAAAAAAADVDVLVNNAGTLASFDVLEASDEALQTDFGTNVFGLLNMARAFRPVLAARPRAVMVNVLTLVSVASMPGIGGYAASKAAAWSLTQALRATLAADGTRVVGVFPGAVDTDMLRGFEMPKASPHDVAAAVLDGLQAEVEDIAPDGMSQQVYAQFLADPKAVERQFAAM